MLTAFGQIAVVGWNVISVFKMVGFSSAARPLHRTAGRSSKGLVKATTPSLASGSSRVTRCR
jgi:hypothetical protein